MKFSSKISIIFLILVMFFYIGYSLIKDTYSNIDDKLAQQILSGEVELTYELFGAKGDGSTNDYTAIKNAHDYANKIYLDTGVSVTVYGTSGKTYYLSKFDSPVNIVTDVDWRNASFIVDDYVDSDGDNINDVDTGQAIFKVVSSVYLNAKYKYINVIGNFDETPKIEKTNDNLISIIKALRDNSNYVNNQYVKEQYDKSRYWGVIPVDNHKQYIRTGANADSGNDQTEIIIIDSVTGDTITEINWDYNDIKSIYVFPVSDNDIVIENGIFLTKTNNVVYETEKINSYSNRNISIEYTGNVTLKNIKHFVDEEAHKFKSDYQPNEKGNLYLGFISLSGTSFVRLENVSLVPRTYTNLVSNGVVTSGGNGTYDLLINKSAYVFLNKLLYSCAEGKTDAQCYQDNMMDSTKWGITGTNYVKNFYIKDSKLNRIDSHKGTTNLYISDTVIGNRGITVTGCGYFYAKNVMVDGATTLISLRNDYGSTWDGNILMDDVTFVTGDTEVPYIISSNNNESHYYGYTTYFPNIIIRSLDIDVSKNTKLDYVSAIKIANLDDIPTDTNKLYYFKPYIYMKNITMSTGTINLFNASNSSVAKNFMLSSYGGDNKVRLNLDSKIEVDSNVTSNSNSKFMFDNSYTDEFFYNNANKMFSEMYDKYYFLNDSIVENVQNISFDRIPISTTYGELKRMINTNGVVNIISHDGVEITDKSIVRTGDKISIKYVDEEQVYPLSVLGDLNGDGVVTIGDVSIVYRYVKGRIELDTVFVNSANIINDDDVTVGDVSRLYRYLKNRVPTLEVIE